MVNHKDHPSGSEEKFDIQHYIFFKKLKKLPFIDEIWLYGSRARGDYQSRSDIDLAFICPKATDANWSQILEIIDDADTLLKIDCVRFDHLNNSNPLKKNILRDKMLIFKADEGNKIES